MRPAITGVVQKGRGGAAPAFTPQRIGEVYEHFGLRAFPGTLNVRVPDLRVAVRLLGEPELYTEHETAIGPLRWWRAEVSHLRHQSPTTPRTGLPCAPVRCLVVRGERTGTNYLEVVAARSLRETWGLCDGDCVVLSPGWCYGPYE